MPPAELRAPMNADLPQRVLLVNTGGDVAPSIAGELAAAGCDVIAAEFDRLPLGLRSRHLVRTHLLPSRDDRALDDTLVGIVQCERPDVVIPVGMRAMIVVCRLRATLEQLTALNVPDLDAFQVTLDHAVCQAECVRLGIPCPRAYSLEQACAILDPQAGATTLVVKPRTDVGAARGLAYVSDTDSLRRCVADCEKRFGGAVIHEFIPGDPTLMRTALLLFDRESRLAAAFTTRKIRQWPPTGGVTAASISTAERSVVDLALPFFAQWRWRGPAEVECKLDPRDGRWKVIEINGRFPGYARFAMLCGMPLGRLTARLALGGVAPPAFFFPDYAVGRKYVAPGVFLRTVFADWRTHRFKLTAIQQAAADAAGAGAHLRSMLSDPLPLVGRLLRDIADIAGRRQR